MDTEALRANFHVSDLFSEGLLNLVYSHIDRVIIGGAIPTTSVLALAADAKDIAADYFLQRREIGIINIGGNGRVTVDRSAYDLVKQDGLYVGKGAQWERVITRLSGQWLAKIKISAIWTWFQWKACSNLWSNLGDGSSLRLKLQTACLGTRCQEYSCQTILDREE